MSDTKPDIEKPSRQALHHDATDDAHYHRYVLEKIRRGQADIAAGRFSTTEEARQRLRRWLSE